MLTIVWIGLQDGDRENNEVYAYSYRFERGHQHFLPELFLAYFGTLFGSDTREYI